MVELMVEEWRRLEWNIVVVDINDFDVIILIILYNELLIIKIAITEYESHPRPVFSIRNLFTFLNTQKNLQVFI
jgi:hypothetical protein